MRMNCQMGTNQQLPWLKEIKKAHGSVEVTSLMQADAINCDGIYTVGKRAWKKPDTTSKVGNEELFEMSFAFLYENCFFKNQNHWF